jgi:hypothetical protein
VTIKRKQNSKEKKKKKKNQISQAERESGRAQLQEIKAKESYFELQLPTG